MTCPRTYSYYGIEKRFQPKSSDFSVQCPKPLAALSLGKKADLGSNLSKIAQQTREAANPKTQVAITCCPFLGVRSLVSNSCDGARARSTLLLALALIPYLSDPSSVRSVRISELGGLGSSSC